MLFFSTSTYAEDYFFCDATCTHKDTHFKKSLDRLVKKGDINISSEITWLWPQNTSDKGDYPYARSSVYPYLNYDDNTVYFQRYRTEPGEFLGFHMERKTLILRYSNDKEVWLCDFISKDQYEAKMRLHDNFYKNYRKERRKGNKI